MYNLYLIIKSESFEDTYTEEIFDMSCADYADIVENQSFRFLIWIN